MHSLYILNKSQNQNVLLTFSQPQNASVIPCDPFCWRKWHIFRPFDILQQVKSLLFYIQLYLKPEKAPISSGRASPYGLLRGVPQPPGILPSCPLLRGILTGLWAEPNIGNTTWYIDKVRKGREKVFPFKWECRLV